MDHGQLETMQRLLTDVSKTYEEIRQIEGQIDDAERKIKTCGIVIERAREKMASKKGRLTDSLARLHTLSARSSPGLVSTYALRDEYGFPVEEPVVENPAAVEAQAAEPVRQEVVPPRMSEGYQ